MDGTTNVILDLTDDSSVMNVRDAPITPQKTSSAFPSYALSVSSDKFNSCRPVMHALKRAGIICNVSQNMSVVQTTKGFREEVGCVITGTEKPECGALNVFKIIQREYPNSFECAHVGIPGVFSGCITSYDIIVKRAHF